MNRVSIVIPVSGHALITRQCLDTLFTVVSGNGQFEREVVVVDDGSQDETPDLLAGYGDRLTVVTNESRQGYSAACNAGAAVATGDLLLFLNNDTVSEENWAAPLVRYAAENSQAAIVGARLLYPNGTIQHAGVVICHDHVPRHIYRCFPAEHPAVMRSRPHRAVTAACMLVRRSVFDELGGFDKSYRNGFEDVDLCLRATTTLGHEVHYCHKSVLVHLEAATRAPEGVDELYGPNLELYRSRWGGLPPDDLLRYIEDGLLEIEYSDVYPLVFRISPLLASTPEGPVVEPFELLAIRSRQVFELLQENAVLRAQLGDEDYARTLTRGQ
jgi:GT2 family glycosyltransferase